MDLNIKKKEVAIPPIAKAKGILETKIMKKEWIEFKERPTLPNRKTKKFNVWSKCSKTIIGTISWYPQWRHYCFFPEEWTVYSDRCLLTISEFITKLNKEHSHKN